jgi:hypothetical protein
MKEIKQIFTRLLTVIYFAVYIALILLVGYLGWVARPQQVSDDSKATITCDNGMVYSNQKPDGTLRVIYAESLSSEEDAGLRLICNLTGDKTSVFDASAARAAGYTDAQIQEYLRQHPTVQLRDNNQLPAKNYSITEGYSTVGNWGDAFKTWIFDFIAGMVVIEIITFVICYIFGINRSMPN